MVKILKEFKEFAVRGNVLDLAVGVIIGGAFGKIVTSMVNDIIMPPISRLLGKVNLADMFINISPDTTKAHASTLVEARANSEVVIAYGNFLNVILDFTIVAFCIFLMVKGANTLRRFQAKETEPAAPTDKECPHCLSKVPIKATRCGHCTSYLKDAPEEIEGGLA
ncbi:large-conductance mechanosensitive channel [Paenibacillus baekrokdamisoli]|uniref:Large-conductance mechanosensitive channel n=1 Tax=Paenibacillus baekrokdamisoli TaxID=1712516 RepID=A0A3G9IVC7_9BACL|nr:large-conductance mechanosensitive channel protein MscL [Paenibacillus baekrokdamisoli]MBB3068197.1 large conductance mechanosensitive channel [Paenibacillus baekrokdamisoli]BBH22760.1 large-conductance mechanosensitive channel [Paenibacillus baekrokdamisoli]